MKILFPVETSTKHNTNTRRSTESDMLTVCWTRYLLESQDYNVTENIVYQDNQSDVLLEKNGNALGSNKTYSLS